MDQLSAQKICRFCRSDVAGKPRIKDKKGRYACQPCFERLKARQAGAQHIPEPRSNPYQAFTPEIDTEYISLETVSEPPVHAQTKRCPSCKVSMGASDVFCISCGTNVQTGGRAGNVKVKKAKVRRERSNDSGTASAIFSIVFALAIGVGLSIGGNPGVPHITLSVSMLLFFAYAGATGILTLVAAYKQDGILRMLLVWFVPFYGLYWIYARAASALLKLNFTLVLVLYIPYFIALSRLNLLVP